MAIARVWQLDAQYWREFAAEQQERGCQPAVMVDKWPEPPPRVWVLSQNQSTGRKRRMV